MMEVKDFISAVIVHIPDRGFKTIRYYGVYERTRKKFYRGLLNRYKSMRSADSGVVEKNGALYAQNAVHGWN
jgi:hypothetical protein